MQLKGHLLETEIITHHIVTKEFIGKTKVKQHQMVHNALGGRMGNEPHALALNTSAPMRN